MEDKGWEQYNILHCPIKECNGMLLHNDRKQYLKCSDCKKCFIETIKFMEIKIDD